MFLIIYLEVSTIYREFGLAVPVYNWPDKKD